MSLLPILVVFALLILVMYFMLNKKDVEQEKEGIVRDILKKDAIAVDFDDGKTTVVKFFGVIPASDNEMMDDKIFSFFDAHLRGGRVLVKPRQVGAGDIVSAEVRTLAGEYVNAILIRHGFARWSVGEAGSDNELADAQEEARSENLGIWNPAVRQLVEEKMRQQSSSGELTDEEIANMVVDPEDQETKENQ